ncbi:MAG: TonB-dependent receptor [Verrucomicrobiota bacterium]
MFAYSNSTKSITAHALGRIVSAVACVGMLSVIILQSASAQAGAGSKRDFDIPAQSLNTAIIEFGKQAGLRVSAKSSILQGKKSEAVSGSLSVETAISRLLASADLDYEIGGRMVTLTQSSRNDGVIQLADITITGEKLGRDLMQTNTSVTVLDASQIEFGGDQIIQDLFQRTANLFGTRDETFSIRGIESSGTGFASTPLASVYIDGVQTTFNQLGRGVGSVFDAESVEVLRGPQSTNLGGAALAGAVIMKTKDPTFYRDTKLQLGLADYDSLDFAVAHGGPLSETFAYRFVLDYDKTDGFIENPVRDADDTDFVDTTTGRVKLLFQPKDGNFSALFAYTRYEGESGENFVWNPTELEFVSESVFKDTVEIDQDMFSLELRRKLGENLELTSISSANDFTSTFTQNRVIGSLPPDPSFLTVGSVIDEIYSQEIFLNFENAKWNSVVGLYYNYKDRQRPQRGSEDHVTVSENNSSEMYTSVALFAEADYRISEKLTATLGARYETNQSDYEDLLAGVGDSSDDSAFIGKAALRYEIDKDQMIGFTFSQAYRPGSVVPAVVGGTFFGTEIDPYDPEFLDNYELTYRGSFLDGRLSVDANLYTLKWDDKQTLAFSFFPVFTASLDNAGEAESEGGELALNFNATENLELYAEVGIAEGEYIEYKAGAFGDLSGNEFEGAPQENYVFGFQYTWDALAVGANAEYVGRYFTNAQNDAVIPSRTVVDFAAKYRYSENLLFTLYVDNLFDKRYTTNLGFARLLTPDSTERQNQGSLGSPRLIGLKANYEF